MSDNKPDGILARANDLVAVFDERKRAFGIMKRTNCPFEQALFLARGGTNADWYSCCRDAPVETEENVLERLVDRLVRLCPSTMTAEQTREWITQAIIETGAAPRVWEDTAETIAIRAEFSAYCDHVRAVVDRAESKR